MKKLFNGILLLSVLLLMECCSNESTSNKIKWIHFDWASQNKEALLIPTKINNIPNNFMMQLDLGMPNEGEIYANTFKPFLNKCPNIILDTTNRIFIYNNKIIGEARNVKLKLGTVYFKKRTLNYHTNYGVSLSAYQKENIIPIIGSIGAGFFKDKYLIIDFKKNKIAILDTLNKYFNKAIFVNMLIENSRLKVPVLINDKQEFFLFDTGSSIFPLVVSQNVWNKIRNKKLKVDTITVNSWGKPHKFFGAKINSTISIGNYKIKAERYKVYCDKLKTTKMFYKKEKIAGIMGNAFFFDKTIIIDYKNKRFGVIR